MKKVKYKGIHQDKVNFVTISEVIKQKRIKTIKKIIKKDEQSK